MTSVVVQSAEKFYRCNRKAFLLVLPHGRVFFYNDRKHIEEQSFSKPAKCTLSTPLPSSVTRIHYQYCKGYNLSISWW